MCPHIAFFITGILVIGVLMSTMSPLVLVLMQIRPEMSPIWYYGVGASRGLISWISVALSALSDVMPPKWRAPSFGLLLAGFSLGFALAPTLALFLSHFHVSVLSLCVLVLGLINTIAFFPETLAPHSALQARLNREARVEGLTRTEKIWWNIKRPLWELSILNRNRLFRLLSSLAFFSGVVSSGDQTLLIYYIEEQLGFNDKDIAIMFLMMGILGIFVQAVVLKILNDAIGERLVITFCFILGAIHNVMYGLARNKATMFLAVGISAFVGMSFPTISAIKSNNVVSSVNGWLYPSSLSRLVGNNN
jgi:DHA1 family tetracycline resistance protein-like MFS transporter